MDTPIGRLPGAGPVTAARLAERGLRTARDLLLRLPRGYDDLRRLTPLGELGAVPDGTTVLVRGAVKRVHVFPRRLLDVVLEADGASLRARWFRVPGAMAKAFAKGSLVALAGPLRTAADGTRELVHPSQVTAALAAAARAPGAGADAAGLGAGPSTGLGLRPRYAPVEGVKASVLDRIRAGALRLVSAGNATELLPEATRARLGLPALGEALVRLHAPRETDPERPEALAPARRRIRIESAFVAQVAFIRRRAALEASARPLAREAARAGRARFEAALPFELTPGQRLALDEIAADLGRARPMQRMLVGDVGSGKTAVALGAVAMAAGADVQALMMVPTEVLAEQQARALAPLAARADLEIGLLTGATPASNRAELGARAAAGRLTLLIGTHALLGGGVTLPKLGLVVIDEQHRFGVEQRARLARAGGGNPHLLTMSATPIPRSLALALHGDLDVSFLVERPAGRRTPATVVCAGPADRQAAYARLQEAIDDGGQAFVVCPVRERARRPGAVTALAAYARLKRALGAERVGLLHGELAPAAKERALRSFADGAVDVLVATTVVELGIDVPGATVMIVEDADRFGLAQLHQLRGRVGRGRAPGICFLCASAGADAAADGRARLELCAALDDGFRLAEADLGLRGFGELDGTAQAGWSFGAAAPGAQTVAEALAEIAELSAVARREAEAVLALDPALAAPAQAALARAVAERAARLAAGEAG